MFKRCVFSLAIWLCLIGCLIVSANTEQKEADKAVEDASTESLNALKITGDIFEKANDAVKVTQSVRDDEERIAIAARRDALKSAGSNPLAKKIADKVVAAANEASANVLDAVSKANEVVQKAKSALRIAEQSLDEVKKARAVQPAGSDYTARKEKADNAKKMAKDAISSLDGHENVLTQSATVLNKARESVKKAVILNYQVNVVILADIAAMNVGFANNSVQQGQRQITRMQQIVENIKEILTRAPTEAVAAIVRTKINTTEKAIQSASLLVRGGMNSLEAAVQQKKKVDAILEALDSETDVEAAENRTKDAESAANAVSNARQDAQGIQSSIASQLQFAINAEEEASREVSPATKNDTQNKDNGNSSVDTEKESTTLRGDSAIQSVCLWNVLGIMIMVFVYIH